MKYFLRVSYFARIMLLVERCQLLVQSFFPRLPRRRRAGTLPVCFLDREMPLDRGPATNYCLHHSLYSAPPADAKRFILNTLQFNVTRDFAINYCILFRCILYWFTNCHLFLKYWRIDNLRYWLKINAIARRNTYNVIFFYIFT